VISIRRAQMGLQLGLAGRLLIGVLLLLTVAAVIVVAREAKTSREQARYISRLAEDLTFQVEPGPSNAIRFPSDGPYDIRHGYVRIPEFVESAQNYGFTVAAQARWSPRLIDLTDKGLFPVYWEKNRAGLVLLGSNGEPMYDASRPLRVYDGFESVPDIVVQMLLQIENRELLDPRFPYRNPAVEWDRLARSVLQLGINQLDPEQRVTGGSTLATQMEKYRHSPEGRTSSVGEKFRQVATASLRAYLNGEETMAARQRIVVEYINSLPLGAVPGHGEVIGLGDGLEAWYGVDFDQINRTLTAPDARPADRALALKQVLSLFLAQRRPAHYLDPASTALEERTNEYVNVLTRDGVLSDEMHDAALAQKLVLKPTDPGRKHTNYVERKAANAVRPRLLSILDVPQLYDLDRLDLAVRTTLDKRVQAAVTNVLSRMGDPEFLDEHNLRGFRLLERGDPRQVIYSFTMYEHDGDANLLRVQVDNFNQPLNINEGVKLELGSTAKLRTIVTYLQIIEDLHAAYAGKSYTELHAVEVAPSDRLTRWALDYLSSGADTTITGILDAALDRAYSASPAEAFFTGGGLHTFSNFEPNDNGAVLSVREALRRSVNLVFIRMMRDIVKYHVSQHESLPELLADKDDPRRIEYLRRFADREGQVFLNRFYRKYKDLDADEALELMMDNVSPTPTRLAVAFRSVAPQASEEEFAAFLRRNLPGSTISNAAMRDLFKRYAIDAYPLQDRAYLSRIHPLELWLVSYLRDHPGASHEEVISASVQERQDAYAWLFKVRSKSRQDWRIQTLLELDAFQEIHARWKALGYPFESLVPSYATAIGSSADRPAALAELVGIILNDGVRYPSVRIDSMVFGAGTPFETRLTREPATGEQVLRKEIAQLLRPELVGIVEGGTAVRLKGAFRRPDGTPIPVGGKTGTGDNRSTTFDSRGNEIRSVAINRTSTFAFLIGDRFFGVLTAYVPGEQADNYGFTSSLPVAILAMLKPSLDPLILAHEPQAAPTEVAGH
jgi:membrane peptidoglycan carboxypeptidase